jgi:pilus assembly protein CpaC
VKMRKPFAAVIVTAMVSAPLAAAANGAPSAANVAARPDSAAEVPATTRVEVPSHTLLLSSGSGQLIRLPRAISGMFIADDKIADVQVKSPTQLYLFAKGAGQTSIFATDKAGAVVWSSEVRVGNNITGVAAMLKTAMPDAQVTATPMGNMLMLTGTVASPKDIEEAERLTGLFTGGTMPVVNRITTATPMQVNLRVRIAEVSRDLVKSIGTNLVTRDTTGGFQFGIGRGTPGTIGSNAFNIKPGLTTFGAAGHLLGLDILSTLDLGETDGLVTTLAEPNLTALSGETASFLAGGEIPIPISQGFGQVSVEYKQYGVGLVFTPVVLANGRISLKVKPEVSQLTSAGSVTLNGSTIPGLSTRRAETTIELGSGQSFMIGGLLNNNTNNSTDKVPGIGALPILGALFRSNSFRRQQTELVIVVTPYLVQPVDAQRIALPTDGYKAPTDAERVLEGKTFSGTSAPRPTSTARQGGAQ